jgi:hypothetical protein
MIFAELKVGDHFIWPFASGQPDSVNINIKIAWTEDGGGFAIDLATRHDCVGAIPDKETREYIAGNAPVIKLNGTI